MASSSSSSSSKFTKDFSKAIADALHEKEDSNKPAKAAAQQSLLLAHNAYAALCYDDPRVESDDACRLLAKELLKGGKYALSERFVDGLRQATSRFDLGLKAAAATTNNNKPANNNATATIKEENDNDIDFSSSVTSATAVGYAILAVTVFCEIPFKCLQATDLETIQTLLGSYRGPQVVEKDAVIEEKLKALNLQEPPNQEQQQQQQEQSPPPPQKVIPENDEVWADESDPSDFVFESNAIDWTAWDDVTIDPERLSLPINDDSWPQVQRAVSNLLQDLTYEKFFPLDATQWKRLALSEVLTQMTLVLLVESKDDTCMMVTEALKKWSVQPINVLRDRVLVDSRCLKDFLSLVQSLIAVDTIQEDPKAPVANATMVGLASLSSICTQAKQLKEICSIRKCVLEACEDLCSLVERVSFRLDNAWVPMIWAFLPLLELIANISADGTILDVSRFVTPAADFQWLLNSGLFRALIVLYTKTSSNNSSVTVDPARHQLLQCLQMLSLQSMPLLGKYAWRVPELNVLIHDDSYQRKHVVDGLVWSLMGQQLAGGSVLRMRNTKTVTAAESKETALLQWQLLCDQVLDAIATLGQLRQQQRSSSDIVDSKDWKEPIVELTRFANCLVSCDTLPPLWKQAMDRDSLQEHVSRIKQALSDLPSAPTKVESAKTTTKNAENDKAGDPLERPDRSFELEVGMVRKAMKVATMSLQQEEAASSRRSLASKTD
jgi:hypothetical protein